MPERVRALLDRILEWWNRFTTRQKTIIVVGAAIALVAVVALATILTRPEYVLLVTADTTSQGSQIRDLLDSNSIDYQMTNDGLQFRVNEKQQADARLLLGANAIQATDYTIESVTSGSFSTTESDKQKRYVAYLESRLASDFIEQFEAIEKANVQLNIPQDDGTLLSDTAQASASILLKLKDRDKFTEDNAAYLARAVAAAVGNDDTNNIVIMDTEGNMLFAGGDESVSGIASSQLTLKNKAEQALKAQVRSVLLGTNLYDSVEVAPTLAMNFSNTENVTHEYYAPEGQTQGLLAHNSTYSSENYNGISGVPGTDSNDETTYVLQDNENSRSTVDEESNDYVPNESITTTTTLPGVIDYEGSTVSVTAINYNVVEEDNYRAADHDNLTWSEYKELNASPVVQTDEDTIAAMRQLVAGATLIPTQNVTIMLYDEMVFFDREGGRISLTDILQIILILVILGLLAFVVLRSMRAARQAEEEGEQPQELSVEQLLESQPDEALENIEMDEGSEAKQMIEKFIEENPEAAASLLRNWINEGFA